MKSIYLLLMFLIVAGCSNRGAYEAVKSGNRNECATLPASQYEDCMKKANIPYDEYARDREELLDN